MLKTSLIPSFEPIELHVADAVAYNSIEALRIEVSKFKTLANPLVCDEKYLPYLAYAFKVDFWSNSLSVEEKRRLILNSMLLHQKKGVIWAIEEVFKALDVEARVTEWNEYGGKPYHFKVELFLLDRFIDEAQISELKKYISIFKNMRSILEEIDVIASPGAKLSIGSGAIAEAVVVAPFFGGYE